MPQTFWGIPILFTLSNNPYRKISNFELKAHIKYLKCEFL